MHTDKKMIKGCVAGNKRAQHRLYKKYAPGLMGVCMRYCKTPEDAEDILQESFVKIYHNINKVKKKDSLFYWMRKIVINQAIRFNYSNRNHISQLYLEDNNQVNRSEISYTIDHSSCEELMALIQELPVGYRTIFNLYAIDGYKHREIAEMLKISEGTSKSQYAHARKMLQLKIQKKTIYEEGFPELKIVNN